MVGPVIVPAPSGPLYHLGHWPQPEQFKPWQYCGRERFDDPLGEFRTLYLAEDRPACFLETIASLRPSLQALADCGGVEVFGMEDTDTKWVVPRDWRLKRGIVQVHVRQRPGLPKVARLQTRPPGEVLTILPAFIGAFLDIREPATAQDVRGRFASLAVELSMLDVDVSSLRTTERQFTQALARWAFDAGLAGIAYRSRHDDRYTCWAVFEGRTDLSIAAEAEPILRDDPDLRAVADLFGLDVET